ncbi:MAG TPA: PEP-CTERM sorting domain-containing protein [Planctomycetota bacterium]|nr:PEP-CTERM sorting domain-containing protein [Planctomycetota bacterium]
MAMRHVATAFCAVSLLAGSEGWAISITFDFQHPDGTGSSFADAMSLNTAGALRDRNGSPIGFPYYRSGDTNGDGRVSLYTLTPGGLRFDILNDIVNGDSRNGAMLGLPFPTTGSGATRITARLSGVAGMDTTYEQIFVGWGASSATNAGNTVWAMIIDSGASSGGVQNFSIYYQAASANTGHKQATGSLPDQVMTVRKLTNTTLRGEFDTNTAAVTDTLSMLNNASAYGYFYVARGGGDGFSGTLTSITFEGPNLVRPQVVPEPATSLLVAAGLLALARRRRRRA